MPIPPTPILSAIPPVIVVPPLAPQILDSMTGMLTAFGLMFTALGTVVGSVLAFFNLLHNRDNTEQIHGLRVEINHRVDQLLIARRAEGHAAGVQESLGLAEPKPVVEEMTPEPSGTKL